MAEIIKPKVKHIVPSCGYFEISKYNEKGKEIKYRLSDKLSSPMAQDKLAEFYESEKKKGNPLPLNSIQVMELLEDAVNSNNNELKNYVSKCLRKNWINTLTRVIYEPTKEDETIHSYGTSDAYSIIGNIVGKEGWIKDIDNPNALELLLKTKDIEKLNKISNVINSTPMYFWRVNSKQEERIKCAVGFAANDDRLYLYVGRNLPYVIPAFLVEKVK